MKTILITGGAGFIGANFIKMLISENLECKLIVVDKLTYAGNLGNLRELWKNDNLIFYKEDISNKQSVEDIFNKHDIDIVINFAAESHVDRSIEDSTPFVVSNILGTQVLLDVCMKKEVEKFIQISTDEVYGSLDDGGEPFTEDHPLKPNNPYAASKAGADLLVRAYNNTYEFPGIITRCSNDYGPYQFPEKLIPLMICNALNDQELP
ncbi:MAG: dTDP-glucose 4,6-dehydratase, partial [Candidatus Hodarchaeota archaeon]